MNQSKQIRKYTHKKLETALKYDNKLSNYMKKHITNHRSWVVCNIAQNNLATVLSLVQACDYPTAYTSKSIKQPKQRQLFSAWTEFLRQNTTQMHTAILANIHLSITDKLIGALIDTYVGFLYISFPGKFSVMPININIIANTIHIPVSQVKKSVRKLGKYAHYFDNSDHLENDI